MTSILAVTCATGGADHAVMTDRMIDSLLSCKGTGELRVVAVAQALDGRIHGGEGITVIEDSVNRGFGEGMNTAIDHGLKGFEVDKVLVLNNDLRFPEENWIKRLLSAPYWPVKSPTMDNTGTAMLKADGPRKGIDYYPFVGATCWMVDARILFRMMRKHGYWLFDPDFGLGYGEDDYAAVMIQRLTGEAKPFQVVRSAWVQHYRAQTSKGLKIDRKAQSALLKRKLAQLR